MEGRVQRKNFKVWDTWVEMFSEAVTLPEYKSIFAETNLMAENNTDLLSCSSMDQKSNMGLIGLKVKECRAGFLQAPGENLLIFPCLFQFLDATYTPHVPFLHLHSQ